MSRTSNETVIIKPLTNDKIRNEKKKTFFTRNQFDGPLKMLLNKLNRNHISKSTLIQKI